MAKARIVSVAQFEVICYDCQAIDLFMIEEDARAWCVWHECEQVQQESELL